MLYLDKGKPNNNPERKDKQMSKYETTKEEFLEGMERLWNVGQNYQKARAVVNTKEPVDYHDWKDASDVIGRSALTLLDATSGMLNILMGK